MARFHKTVLANPFIPHKPHPKQALFLLHDETREAIYGGAAGGGKTDALLMAALQYAHVPGYAALVLMRTYKDLTLPKAGASRAREWLAGSGAKWDRETTTWRFPSGATLTFGYLDHQGAEERYRTAEFQFVGFDELTRFDEAPYLYLFTRLRRLTGSDVPVRMRAATNPGGRGHEWVKRRFVPDEYLRLKGPERFGRTWWKEGRLFCPARLEDNPSLDAADYELSLAHLPPLLRARMREGDWSAHESGHFRPEWFKTYRDLGDAWQVEHTREIIKTHLAISFVAVDPAGGISEGADYTAIVVCCLTPGRSLLILDVVRERLPVEAIVPRLAEVCRRWRPAWVTMESAFLQSAYIRAARATPGIPTVHPIDPGGSSKLVRATPAILKAEQGGICLPHPGPAHPWLEALKGELCAFTGDERLDAHDDQVDALAYGVLAIDRFGLAGGGEPVMLGGRRGAR